MEGFGKVKIGQRTILECTLPGKGFDSVIDAMRDPCFSEMEIPNYCINCGYHLPLDERKMGDQECPRCDRQFPGDGIGRPIKFDVYEGKFSCTLYTPVFTGEDPAKTAEAAKKGWKVYRRDRAGGSKRIRQYWKIMFAETLDEILKQYLSMFQEIKTLK